MSGTPSTPPGSGDDVIIGDFVPGNQPTLSANTAINSLTINGRSATTGALGGTLRINTGRRLTIAGNLAINGSTGGGTGIALLGIDARGSGSVSVGGNVTLTNSTGGPPEEPQISLVTGTLTVTGDMALGTAATFTAGTGAVAFNKTSGTQTLNNASADNFSTITKTGSGTLQLLSDVPILRNLTVSAGTLDLSTFTANRTAAGGTLTVSNGALLMIGGTNTLPSNYNTHTIGATSTVEYAGTDQTVAEPNGARTYGNLTLSGSGTKTLQAATTTIRGNLTLSGTVSATAVVGLTINTDFIIGPGTTFSAGSYTHTMQGEFSNSGTFSAETSTIQLTGTADVTITGATTFNNLTVNKSVSTNTITLANDISVATLTMTRGNILTGSNNLTVTSDRTGNGLIIGTITRTHIFNASTSYAFEGPNTSLTFASGGTLPTSVTLTTTLSSPGVTTSMDPIDRHYSISQTGGSAFSYTLRIHYENIEVSSPNSETSPPLKVWRRTSTGPDTWAREGSSASNTTNNWVEQSGITNTGIFSLSSRTVANMVLTLLQSVTNPSPGAQVTYTLQYSNSGDGTSTNTLFTASAPTQTTYVAASIMINGVSKTDGADADEVTVSGSAISINLGTLASGAAGNFIYTVSVY